MHHVIKAVSFLLISAFLLSSCNQSSSGGSNVDDLYPEIGNYISSYTKRPVSIRESVIIRLANPVRSAYDAGGKSLSKAVAISPNVVGEFVWDDEYTIRFTPTSGFESGSEYVLTLDLNAVDPSAPEKFNKVNFPIQTKQLSAQVRIDPLFYGPTDSESPVVLTGYVKTSDVVDNGAIESMLQLSQNEGSKPEVVWNHYSATDHGFTIQKINRPESANTISVSWDGKGTIPQFAGSQQISVSPKGEFTVNTVNTSDLGALMVEVAFTDPIKTGQDLQGLISIDGVSEGLRTEIEGNFLRIYPNSSPGQGFELTLNRNILGTSGKKLGRDFSYTLSFEAAKPEVRALRAGNIFPDINQVVFPIEARNLQFIEVDVLKIYQNNVLQFLQYNSLNYGYDLEPVAKSIHTQRIDLSTISLDDNTKKFVRYAIDLSGLVNLDPGAMYQLRIGFRLGDSPGYICADDVSNSDEFSEMNIWDYGNSYIDYDYYKREDPCHKTYYGTEKYISRNIMASNIALIAKANENNDYQIISTSIENAEPIKGLKVELYDFQKQLLASGTTDADGVANVHTAQKASFVIGSRSNEFAYLSMLDRSANVMSDFDIGGKAIKKGIDAYIYGERGVWRPGDTLHLTVMVQSETEDLPKNHPVSLEVVDSRGKKQFTAVQNGGKGGLYYFPVPTMESAPTGNWQATAIIGNQKFLRSLKIETVKPNRIRIQYADESASWNLTAGALRRQFSAEWLHGASAQGLKAEAELQWKESTTKFDGYGTFSFDDPARTIESFPFQVFAGNLDAGGKASYTVPKNPELLPPGKLTASVKTRVYEKSGNFSEYYYDAQTDYYPAYVGVKMPQSQWGGNFIMSGEETKVPLIIVDRNGKPVANKTLNIGLYTGEWSWWYGREDANLYRYNTAQHIGALEQTTVRTNAQGVAEWKAKIDDEYGNYMVRICDQEGGHCTGAFFYTSSWSRPMEGSDGPQKLNFTSDKASYQLGENAVITLPSNADSKILISLEGNQKIHRSFWVKGEEGTTKVSIPTTAEMSPNIYVHASLVQPYAKTNDLPIRMYGVIPLKVVNKETLLEPQLAVPAEIEPDKAYEIVVSEKGKKAMSYSLAIVDDGLLDLTRFKTPSPWDHFYAKQTLGIKTWDFFDFIAGAYGSQIENSISIGGDAALISPDAKRDQRFKPVVQYMGPFTLEKGKTNKHSLLVKDYVGSVRVMVVARDNKSYGSGEKTLPVRKPLMVQSTLPRVLGLGESLALGVNVFAMDASVKQVQLEAKTNNLVSLTSDANASLSFSQTGDKLHTYMMNVGENAGTAKISIAAKSGSKSAAEEISIAVRNSNPSTTEVVEAVLKAGENSTLPFVIFGTPGTNQARLEITTLPPFNLAKRLEFLIQYPYGCIEQTTSAAFPQLYLADLTELTPAQKDKTNEAVRRAINRIALFQTLNGGFSYWPGNQQADVWASNYAGHFLIEAKSKGYFVPGDLLTKWTKYQQSVASNFSVNTGNGWTDYSSKLDQAYRLYVLALNGSPELGAMNRLSADNKRPEGASYLLAAAYTLAGRDDLAKKLITGVGTEIKSYVELGNTYGSSLRDRALISLSLNGMKNDVEEAKMVRIIAAELNSENWYSTQSTAFALNAISKYAEKVDGNGITATVTFGGKNTSIKTNKSLKYMDLDVAGLNDSGTLSIKNEGSGLTYVRVTSMGQRPPQPNASESNSHIQMKVRYIDEEGKTLDPASLKQGTNFYARFDITNPGTRNFNLQEVALTQIFPSGWEINNERMTGISTPYTNSPSDYVDYRDDRVSIFFDLYGKNTVTYYVSLTAAYQGRFFLPTTVCAAMYDNEIRAQSSSKWVEVN